MKKISPPAHLWAFVLLVAILPAGAGHAQGDTQTFPETGKTVKGRFLEYWRQNGGLAQQGYPITDEMQERSDTDGKTYTVQYFERAIFEAHPENQKPYDVLLSLLGVFQFKAKYSSPASVPPEKINPAPGARKFPETGKTVGGKFLEYWNKNGGLAQQGYPITEEFQEVSPLNGKTYTVQYFERAVFELHPENQPPYDVLLSQLGTFRYHARYGTTTAKPGTGIVKLASSMSAARACHSATLLPNGNVLIAGGMVREGQYERGAELFDPRTDTFRPTGSMARGRACHTATLLPNGKVLVAGGESGVNSAAELYDPSTGTFTPTGDMNAVRDGATATLLKNGRVLIAG
ncbi:MAG: kelch motif-containing protein, partial [Chloroflexota bacterium]|nr:kelch motif-containing protein [Chloroflexota bacterium]